MDRERTFDEWLALQNDQKCTLCRKTKELYSSPYCVNCVLIIYGAKGNGLSDNFVGYVCTKLGLGLTPMAVIVAGEMTLSHIMHHAVILPTPVGYEMFEMTTKLIYTINGYKEKVEQSKAAKLGGRIFSFLSDGVFTWKTYAMETRLL